MRWRYTSTRSSRRRIRTALMRVAARGQQSSSDEGLRARATRPPLYTNNKLTPADGFHGSRRPSREVRHHVQSRSEPIRSSRSDPARHRLLQSAVAQGRVVSQHVRPQRLVPPRWRTGSIPVACATTTLPTGWKPFGGRMYPVKGHQFGLELSVEEDRGAFDRFPQNVVVAESRSARARCPRRPYRDSNHAANANLQIGLQRSPETRRRLFLLGATKASSNAAVTRWDTGCFDRGEKLAGCQGFETRRAGGCAVRLCPILTSPLTPTPDTPPDINARTGEGRSDAQLKTT